MPHLPERFLAPKGFVWGRFMTADGAVLRWGHLPVRGARAECVIAGGFGDFIESNSARPVGPTHRYLPPLLRSSVSPFNLTVSSVPSASFGTMNAYCI